MAKLAEEFTIIDDTTDARLLVFGHTLEDVFVHGLRALASVLNPDSLKAGQKGKKVKEAISIQAVDINSLFTDFLTEVVSHVDMSGAVFTEIEFDQFGDNFLEGKISGVVVDEIERDINSVDEDAVDIKRNAESGLYETELVFTT